VRPRADQALAWAIEALEEIENGLAVRIGPAADDIDVAGTPAP
jgi:hypothetical protein